MDTFCIHCHIWVILEHVDNLFIFSLERKFYMYGLDESRQLKAGCVYSLDMEM